MNKYIELAINEAKEGLRKKEGGPFGAVIVKDDKVISSAHNMVLLTKDPTAHAEVSAIREASRKLNSYDLSECTLYTTSEPCPLCMSAIIWSGIKNVYYGADRKDTSRIGFRDEFIYKYLSGEERNVVNAKQINRDECLGILDSYHDTIY